MEEKKNISKQMYKLMTWGFIFGGIIINSLFSYLYIMNIEKIYSPYLMGIGLGIIGIGIGLAISRTYSIEGIDY